MSELQGQMDIGSFMPGRETGAGDSPEGYDAQGHLINPDAAEPDEASARRLDVLAGEINLLEESAKDVFRRTAMEIGRRLCEARNLVPRGAVGRMAGRQNPLQRPQGPAADAGVRGIPGAGADRGL